MQHRKINFNRVNDAALASLPSLVASLLPHGKRKGSEWVSRNPKRNDKHAGSFSINLTKGVWADFATGDGGNDPISLMAYLFNCSQYESALWLSETLGVAYAA